MVGQGKYCRDRFKLSGEHTQFCKRGKIKYSLHDKVGEKIKIKMRMSQLVPVSYNLLQFVTVCLNRLLQFVTVSYGLPVCYSLL